MCTPQVRHHPTNCQPSLDTLRGDLGIRATCFLILLWQQVLHQLLQPSQSCVHSCSCHLGHRVPSRVLCCGFHCALGGLIALCCQLYDLIHGAADGAFGTLDGGRDGALQFRCKLQAERWRTALLVCLGCHETTGVTTETPTMAMPAGSPERGTTALQPELEAAVRDGTPMFGSVLTWLWAAGPP